jgi:hypothetical protein
MKPTCKTCRYREELPIDPNNLQRMAICKRFPPTPVLMPAAPQQMQIVPMFPLAADDMHCFEHSPAEIKLN